MLMQMNDGYEHSLMASYSPTATDALGVRSDYMREDEYWLHTATYNRLLKRWNAPDSQGNLYLQTGLGAAIDGTHSEAAASVGIEADWESRRLYTSYENRFVEAGRIDRAFTQKARVGVAPYVGGYDDVHTWLMVQVEHLPQEGDAVVVTPFIRIFTQEILGEIGISDRKDVMLNVTFQY